MDITLAPQTVVQGREHGYDAVSVKVYCIVDRWILSVNAMIQFAALIGFNFSNIARRMRVLSVYAGTGLRSDTLKNENFSESGWRVWM
jgi:hypothetical protein